MNKIATLLALAVTFASGTAFAGWSTTPVALANIEIDTTTAGNGTFTYIGFAATPDGKPSCGSGDQGLLSGTPDHVRAMTSLATAAFLAGKSVRVKWDGTCSSVYARITNILVQ